MDQGARGVEEEKLSQDKVELIPVQFKHEAVSKFIMDLVGRRIRLRKPGEVMTEKKHINNMAFTHTKFIDNVTAYCSGKIHGNELDNLETRLFDDIAFYITAGFIEDQYYKNTLEDDIKRIEDKIDSTNKLLTKILKVWEGEGNDNRQ